MASLSHWQVLGSNCSLLLSDVIEPDEELTCTQFLMGIKATIFSEEDNDLPPTEETYSKKLELDLLMNENESRTKIAEALVSDLHVPAQICESMVDKIVQDAVAEETSCRPCTDYMVVHMEVSIQVSVAASGGLDMSEPKFVAASKSSIEKLERTRVEVSTMCSICMEEITVGSEATSMPCSHLYHGGCIVNWLEKSRFCPLCRYSMPADTFQPKECEG